ncbi:MAG: hypothetical protein DYG89_46960 [Caldilinea sp. CFX5]|nr:hypothetical protein [Caldilinea sp. CFX5]
MYDQDWCLRPSTRLFRYSMTIFTIVTLTALFFVSVLAQAPTRDTRSWTDPGGSGLTITFSTPKTYESCTSASDRIFTSGIPDNWSLLGAVDVYWATTTGAEKISSIPVRQNGNLDLTIPYPPSSTWPDLTSIGNPLRELHIVVGILVRDQTGTEVSWVGGDLVNAPGILGAGGQVWDVICLPTGATPTPTNTPISQLGSLGDRVWRDDNGNGIQDNGEPGIPGASVVLLDCSGNTLTSSSTNASGNYLFGNLNAGCYVVQFDPVSGLSYSPANQGADDTKDSDANPAGGRTGPINLGSRLAR